MTHAGFIGKIMHQVELRPERAFANFVPMRPFALRHLGRMLRARLFHKTFGNYDIFDQRAIIKGARKAFELISQSIYKNDLHGLAERSICSEKTVERFSEVMHEMSTKQHNLLNLSQEDIISIAPGVLGPFQNIRQLLRENVVHLTYSILCCALYKKKILFDAVEKLPLLDPKDVKEDSVLPIPSEYGYVAPRIVFAYIDFSHLLDTATGKVDPMVMKCARTTLRCLAFGGDSISTLLASCSFDLLRCSGCSLISYLLVMRCARTTLRCLAFGGDSVSTLLASCSFDLLRCSGPFSALTISQCAQLRNDKQVKGDTELLSHVWARFRTYPNDRLPSDQREFWISRNGYLQKEGVKKLNVIEGSRFVFLKPTSLTRWLELILRRIGMFILDRIFGSQLPKRIDVIRASHQAFSIIVDAIHKSLETSRMKVVWRRPCCIFGWVKKEGDLCLDFIESLSLLDHPLHNMRIVSAIKDDSTRSSYLLYGVMLVALYKKKLLFNAVCNHPLPSTYQWGADDRMVLKMPPGYGFLQRKHLVVYLEFAQPLNLETRSIADDVTLFDFHIACF
uniref:Uncharacterized protein n=1 Tax=Ascaris lumbricoides TaxID=6252 RepID=A0A9J2Q483_ASCLU